MKQDQASATARVIAAATVLLANHPTGRHLVPTRSAELCAALLGATATDRWLRASALHPLTRMAWGWLECLTLPGIVRHYALRKACIERWCRAELAAGARRVLVLGAGFDTLALRLASEFAQVQWVEVDHPATQGAKRRALAAAAIALPANLQFMPFDLNVPDGQSEPALPVSPAAVHTLVIAEGLLMYLQPQAVAALLRKSLPALCAPAPLWVVFSYMARWPTGRSGFRPASWLVDWWLGWRAEPFCWYLAPDAAATWLGEQGHALVEHAQSPLEGAADTGLGPRAPVLRGENLVLAQYRSTQPLN